MAWERGGVYLVRGFSKSEGGYRAARLACDAGRFDPLVRRPSIPQRW